MTSLLSLWPILFLRTSRFMRLLLGISGPYRVVFARRRWVALLMIGVFMMTVESSPVLGQSSYDDGPAPAMKPPGSASGSSLPAWAEPRPRSSPASDGPVYPDAPITTMNGPPDNPNRVPLGGIEWLILAGAGYGIFRLKKSDGH